MEGEKKGQKTKVAYPEKGQMSQEKCNICTRIPIVRGQCRGRNPLFKGTLRTEVKNECKPSLVALNNLR